MEMAQPLDNPFWSSLTTLHRTFARGAGAFLRFPPEVAPFAGVAPGAVVTVDELSACIAPAETVLSIGEAPRLPVGWECEDLGDIVQMVYTGPLTSPGTATIVPLGDAHQDAILALTARVYPHYFRRRTVELGRYFGIFVDGALAAMAGERMGMPGFREISAVCTYPEMAGRGFARQLLTYLANDILARGATPFLHVSPDNTRARSLYEQNGWRVRATLPFWGVRRA